MEHAKVCPFAAANPQQENSDCLGDACACYVKMHKPRCIASAEYKMADPEYFYRYFGCGLVSTFRGSSLSVKGSSKLLKVKCRRCVDG